MTALSPDIADQIVGEPKLVGRPDVNRKRLARMGWIFTAPALIVIAAVTIFPIVYSIVMSLNKVNVTGNGFSLDGFTFSNYNLLLHSSLWRDALIFTLYYTAVTVVVELIIGTCIALVLERLAAGGDIVTPTSGSDKRPSGGSVRRAILVNTSRAYLSLDEVVEETGAREELIAELENFGIVQPEKREGKTVYDETDREVVRSANELSRVGVAARNLRVFRSSADREANLLEALLGPSLRSRNPDRRKEALESLESLAATVSHLKHLLLVRDLRRLAGD